MPDTYTMLELLMPVVRHAHFLGLGMSLRRPNLTTFEFVDRNVEARAKKPGCPYLFDKSVFNPNGEAEISAYHAR